MTIDIGIIQWLIGGVFALLAAVIVGAWAVFKYASAGFKDVHTHLNAQMALKQNALETMRNIAERRYAESSRRDAELSERITAMRLELFQQLTSYVTRSELDKRLEKIEHTQETMTEKLDAVLFRLRDPH